LAGVIIAFSSSLSPLERFLLSDKEEEVEEGEEKEETNSDTFKGGEAREWKRDSRGEAEEGRAEEGEERGREEEEEEAIDICAIS